MWPADYPDAMAATDPIVLAIDLAVPPESAYEAFTRRFGEWWPAATHSLSRAATTRCRLESKPGGAVDELAPDGARHVWGEVLAVDPGRRIRFSWYPGREADSAQWIEVVFDAAPGGSRATLTHGGWEALGEIGPLLRQEYLPGWRYVLGELFAAYVATSDRDADMRCGR
jgi:uncharacterized protein YndB with AHSA1/START domain